MMIETLIFLSLESKDEKKLRRIFATFQKHGSDPLAIGFVTGGAFE